VLGAGLLVLFHSVPLGLFAVVWGKLFPWVVVGRVCRYATLFGIGDIAVVFVD